MEYPKEQVDVQEELYPLLVVVPTNEEKKIKRYIWELSDNIQRNVTSTKPIRLQDAVRLANSLMDQKSECLRLKNQNRRNQAGNGEAWGRAYALGRGEAYQDPIVITGMFLLNNRYASILFDTSADRSFVSTTFSSLIDIVPTALDTRYTIELDDGKFIGTDTIIQGCTPNFLNHPFNIDLMPVELGSFDVIIGMD
ncbi:putative reverse transcriptase domain-containing protein [Tanacetum coccineum]|uniref:Reverse transcriptase domain-containing protein n=1 Tax=Tanacetum coccineum TaxID=301880 RepID=A0ABQ5JA59_9ASTR